MTAHNLPEPPPPSSTRLPAVDDLIPRLQAMTATSPAQETIVEKSVLETPSQLHQTVVLAKQPTNTTESTPVIGSVQSTMGKTMSNTPVHEARRPSTPRAQTDPSSMFEILPTHNPRPRNRSPYSRSHLRSHSSSTPLTAPPMMRAHSLPTAFQPAGYLALSPSAVPGRPSSPLRSPKRTRSPRSQPPLHEDTYAHAGAPSVCDISEDAELQLTPKPGPLQPSPMSGLYSSTGSLSRRRRPASPLHQIALGASVNAPLVRTPTSGSSSPSVSSAKFNEPFPGMSSHYSSSYASSSVPSTPTSMRSRSPSISSLETIPDSPDAEVEAIEADRIAKLKAAADNEDSEGTRRSSLDVPAGTGRTFGFGKRDSRKRWSVCGAERRQDLDLETIWED